MQSVAHRNLEDNAMTAEFLGSEASFVFDKLLEQTTVKVIHLMPNLTFLQFSPSVPRFFYCFPTERLVTSSYYWSEKWNILRSPKTPLRYFLLSSNVSIQIKMSVLWKFVPSFLKKISLNFSNAAWTIGLKWFQGFSLSSVICNVSQIWLLWVSQSNHIKSVATLVLVKTRALRNSW